MRSLTDFSAQESGRVAIFIANERISFARFEHDIGCAAEWLSQQGLSHGARVGVLHANYYWNWVFHLASLRLGLAVCSLTPGADAASLASLRLDAGVGSAQEAKPGLRWLCAPTDDMRPLAGPYRAANPEDERYAHRINLTSGTTGSIKIVNFSCEILRMRVERVFSRLPHGADTRLFCMQNITSTNGFHFPLATWQAGGQVYLTHASDGNEGLGRILSECNLLKCTPNMLRWMLEKAPGVWAGRETRTVAVGGGRLPDSLRDEALQRICERIATGYGSTEAGTITKSDGTHTSRHPGAVGFINENASLEIVDEDGRPVPTGQPGIVRVRSTFMVDGYENDENAKASSAFRDGWFYPGDEGLIYEDGLVAINGRTSDVVNIGGSKISILQIESKMDNWPELKDHCTVGITLPEGDKLAVAVVCADDASLKDIHAKVRKLLPRQVRFVLLRVKAIPRNAMGKVSRVALREALTTAAAAQQPVSRAAPHDRPSA